MVCLLAAPWVRLSVSAGNGWPHNALRHHWLMLISCHFRDCKALLVTSLTHVSGAIASVADLCSLRCTCKYNVGLHKRALDLAIAHLLKFMKTHDNAPENDLSRSKNQLFSGRVTSCSPTHPTAGIGNPLPNLAPSDFFRRTLLRYVRLMPSQINLSLSLTLLRPTQTVELFRDFCTK